jgi:PAS domain S-box-containing protein
LLRRQADLLDQSHDAIFTWKIGGGITYRGRGAEELYGYTSEEAIGRISHELLQTRAHIGMQDVEAQIAQQDSWYGELTHTTRDGHEIRSICGVPDGGSARWLGGGSAVLSPPSTNGSPSK